MRRYCAHTYFCEWDDFKFMIIIFSTHDVCDSHSQLILPNLLHQWVWYAMPSWSWHTHESRQTLKLDSLAPSVGVNRLWTLWESSSRGRINLDSTRELSIRLEKKSRELSKSNYNTWVWAFLSRWFLTTLKRRWFSPQTQNNCQTIIHLALRQCVSKKKSFKSI